MALRTGRNSVPKVNQNPRPPNEPKFGLARAQPVGARVGKGGGLQAPNVQAGLGNNRALPKPKANNVGQAPAPLPSPPPAAPPVDPRDSQYWADYAKLGLDKNLALEELNTADVFDKTRYDRELSNRQYLEPIEMQRLREKANVGGFIYSTAHQEDKGNLAQEQFQTRSGLEEAFRRAIQERAFQKQGIQNDYSYMAGTGDGKGGQLYREAVDRAAMNELNRPVAPEVAPAPPVVQALVSRATGANKKKQNKNTNKIGLSQNRKAR